MNCIHRNGKITGYSVRYGVQGQSIQTTSVLGADVTETTISSLLPSTTYSIEVAAVNSADTGPYSDPITTETEGIYFVKLLLLCHVLTCSYFLSDALSGLSIDSSTTTTLTIICAMYPS